MWLHCGWRFGYYPREGHWWYTGWQARNAVEGFPDHTKSKREDNTHTHDIVFCSPLLWESATKKREEYKGFLINPELYENANIIMYLLVVKSGLACRQCAKTWCQLRRFLKFPPKSTLSFEMLVSFLKSCVHWDDIAAIFWIRRDWTVFRHELIALLAAAPATLEGAVI